MEQGFRLLDAAPVVFGQVLAAMIGCAVDLGNLEKSAVVGELDLTPYAFAARRGAAVASRCPLAVRAVQAPGHGELDHRHAAVTTAVTLAQPLVLDHSAVLIIP